MTYDIIIKNNIKKYLKGFREANGLGKKEMAKALDTEYSTYRSWETARSAPKHFMLLRIAKMMNVSVDELLYGAQVADEINCDSDDIYGDKFLSELSNEEKIIVMKIRQLNTKDRNELSDYIDKLTKDL